jgi:cyclic-di-GMP-binding protein
LALGKTWETDKVAAARPAVDFGRHVPGPRTKESKPMAQENSFDIVSKVDIQEVRNAIDQALKEIRQRFDLKDSRSEITLVESDKEIQLASAGEYKLEAVKEILGQKLVKRGVSLKNLTYEKLEQAAGQSVRQKIKLQQGIPIEKAKEIVRLVKDSKKKAQASIQGDTVRISSKDRDELQAIIALLRGKDLGVDLQFTNYRTN